MKALVVAAFVCLLPLSALAQARLAVEPYVFGGVSGIGLVSGDLFYRFRSRHGVRVTPYVAGGFSTSAFRGTASPFANVAIGADLNVGHKAIRFEVREHAGLSNQWSDRHIFGMRVGFVWTR